MGLSKLNFIWVNLIHVILKFDLNGGAGGHDFFIDMANQN